MAGSLIPDAVWEQVEQLLPARPVSQKGGRPPIGDREVLTGIVFVLKTGIPWEELPLELGCGCGMTCLRRLRSWQQAGVWPRVQSLLEDRLRPSKKIDWSRLKNDDGDGRDMLCAEVSSTASGGVVDVLEDPRTRTFADPHPLPPVMPFHRPRGSAVVDHQSSRAMEL